MAGTRKFRASVYADLAHVAADKTTAARKLIESGARLPSRSLERKESKRKLAAAQAERAATAALSAPELTAAVKARAAQADKRKAPESLGRCKTHGESGDLENTGAKHRISPNSGTTMPDSDGVHFTGVCPLCGTRARLHRTKKVMLVHTMRGETLPASPALSEPNVEPTDTGARVGDPLAGSKRRADMIDGAYERGTVAIMVPPADGGKAERVDVPATLENLETALTQGIARRKRLRSADSIKAQDVLVLSLRRKVDAARKGKGALKAPRAGAAVGGRDHGRLDGPALVQGRTEGTLTHAEWSDGQTGKPGPTTLDEPLGRVRPDAGALGAPVTVHDRKVKACDEGTCDHIAGGSAGHLTYAQVRRLARKPNRRYWATVAKVRARRERERAFQGARQAPATGQPFGCKALVADESRSLRETDALMRQAPGGNSERMDKIASRS